MVGEIVGAEGKGLAPAEYRFGLRWEPNLHAVFALIDDEEFEGGENGAGLEIGMMLFSPPFFGIGMDKWPARAAFAVLRFVWKEQRPPSRTRVVVADCRSHQL